MKLANCFSLSSVLILLLFAYSSHAQVKSGAYQLENTSAVRQPDATVRSFISDSSFHFEQLSMDLVTLETDDQITSAPDKYERLIILKTGVMQLTLNGEDHLLGDQSVVLIQPGEPFQIANADTQALSYYEMKYLAKNQANQQSGKTSLVLNADSLQFKPSSKGGGRKYFDQPTSMCERFEIHITQLNTKGPSHQPHTHLESEIILVIAGDTEMMIDDKTYRVKPGDFYFANSGTHHGISNISDRPCMYFAFKWM